MLKIENAVLVIVDVQGRLATLMYDKEEFFQNMVTIIEGAKILEIPILWNEQIPDKLGPTIPEIKEILSDKSPLVKKSSATNRRWSRNPSVAAAIPISSVRSMRPAANRSF